MLILLVLHLITVVQAEWTSNEVQGNKTIFELDDRIYKLILQPEKGKDDEIYQLLFKVHYALNSIYEVANQGLDDPTTIELGKKVMNKKGLKIFTASINEELLKETYNWDQKLLRYLTMRVGAIVSSLCLVYCVRISAGYFSIEVDAEKVKREKEEEYPIVQRCNELKQQLETAEGYGGPLIRGLHDFQEDLRYLFDDVKRNRATKMRLKIYFQLKEKGGPAHLTACVKGGLLRETFGWTSYEVNEIQEMIRDSQMLWDKIGQEIEKNKITPPPL